MKHRRSNARNARILTGKRLSVKRRRNDVRGLTAKEKNTMSLSRAISILEERSDSNTCDGDCDDQYPFVKCTGCEATAILNDIGIMVREAL